MTETLTKIKMKTKNIKIKSNSKIVCDTKITLILIILTI